MSMQQESWKWQEDVKLNSEVENKKKKSEKDEYASFYQQH